MVANAMTPRQPHLPDSVSKWKPEELFYIVKHGIKFTGMPAWPTQQRDEPNRLIFTLQTKKRS
jgi:hypothetical protein